MIAMLLTVALAGAATDTGDPVADAPKRYTPEIRGQLLDGAKPVSSNVCLRQSDSEIRMCGYTDAAGNFYIPSHSTRPIAGSTATTLPTFWLEIGRVTEAKKIGAVDASEDKRVSLTLECNLASATDNANAIGICRRASAGATTRTAKGAAALPRPSHPGR